MTRHHPTARAAGFSLLELLVAMSVLALSLTLLYQVEGGVLRGVADYGEQQRATVLAQSLLDAREAVPAAGWSESGRDGVFEWSVQSTPQALPAGLNTRTPLLHEVRISIRWPGGQGAARQLDLTTALPQATPEAGERLP